MAAAKALRLDFDPVVGRLDTADGDIAPGVQVRSTKYESGHLLLHDSDFSDHRFILVVGRAPKFRLAGWLRAADGRTPDRWRCHRGRCAYWVPQEALKPMASFRL